jgi:hypothetical protein
MRGTDVVQIARMGQMEGGEGGLSSMVGYERSGTPANRDVAGCGYAAASGQQAAEIPGVGTDTPALTVKRGIRPDRRTKP